MWGTVYRIGMHIKDAGETLNMAWLQRVGIRLEDAALEHMTGWMYGGRR